MKVKALVSFAGIVNMAEGEVREIPDKDLCEDLLHAGYIEEVEKTQKAIEKEEKAEVGAEKSAPRKPKGRTKK